jgi:hypothetical protein
MKNPESGFDPLLEERMRVVLPLCDARRIKIVTNWGAVNPEGAAKKAAEIARSLDLSSLKISANSVIACDPKHHPPLQRRFAFNRIVVAERRYSRDGLQGGARRTQSKGMLDLVAIAEQSLL